MAVMPREQKKKRRSELARLSQENLPKAVFLLAWPVVVEMLLQSSVGIADVAMVGRLGPASIAAIGLCNQFVMLLLTVFAAVRTGTTVLVARLAGAGDVKGASRAAKQSLILSIAASLVLAAFGVLMPELGMRFLGAEQEVISAGVGYMRFKSLSIIFAIIVMTSTGILRGCGNTLTSMWVNATINISNIFLNWIFIFGNLGMPAMGAAGAGFATMIARAVGSALILSVLVRGSSTVKISLRGNYRLQWQVVKRILNVGIPAAVEQILLRGAQVFFTMIVTGLGTNMYAAHQIALRADSVAFMPGFGFAVAATTLVGQNLGAEQPETARKAGYLTMYMGIGFMTAMGALLFTFARPVVGFFTTEPEVIAAGAKVLRIMAFAMPFMAIARISAGALRGAGDTRFVMWGTGFGIWAARLGLAFVFVKVLGWGLTGAWLGMCADHITRAVIFLVRWHQGRWVGIKL